MEKISVPWKTINTLETVLCSKKIKKFWEDEIMKLPGK